MRSWTTFGKRRLRYGSKARRRATAQELERAQALDRLVSLLAGEASGKDEGGRSDRTAQLHRLRAARAQYQRATAVPRHRKPAGTNRDRGE